MDELKGGTKLTSRNKEATQKFLRPNANVLQTGSQSAPGDMMCASTKN